MVFGIGGIFPLASHFASSPSVLALAPGNNALPAASLAQTASLARTHVGAEHATIVVVGPRDEVLSQLASAGLGTPELWGPDGVPEPRAETAK